MTGLDVHPLHLGGRPVEKADGATADRPVAVARHEKGAAATFEMLWLEVRTEALLGRIQLGEAGVQPCDQSARVVGVEEFGLNGQAHVANLLRLKPLRKSPLYPEIEPYDHGMLDVGDGNDVYWEICGNPGGKPAVVFHGGPGSGCGPGWRRYFNPAAYRVVLFDQRGCGRSLPHASDPAVDLAVNTTQHLIGDIEKLRDQLGIERWLVVGGSWGSTLALAYGERFPAHVSEMVLFSVVTTSRGEVRWVTRDVGRYFPAEWAWFRDGVPPADRDGDLVAAYYRLLHHRDPGVREEAARDWCRWEDAHVAVRSDHRHDTRYDDPRFRMVFARLVTHYWHHAGFLEDGALLRDAGPLAGIPGVLIHGRLDLSSPLDIPWQLSHAWPGSELIVLDDAGHGAGEPGMQEALLAAIDRFATTP